ATLERLAPEHLQDSDMERVVSHRVLARLSPSACRRLSLACRAPSATTCRCPACPCGRSRGRRRAPSALIARSCRHRRRCDSRTRSPSRSASSCQALNRCLPKRALHLSARVRLPHPAQELTKADALLLRRCRECLPRSAKALVVTRVQKGPSLLHSGA